jgi:hypothetical protein
LGSGRAVCCLGVHKSDVRCSVVTVPGKDSPTAGIQITCTGPE